MKPVKLCSSLSYRKASCAQREAVCNGCGSARAKFDFVPDSIWGLSIEEACDNHDWDYHEGEIFDDKVVADRTWLNNMLRIIDARSKSKIIRNIRRNRAHVMYKLVCKYGGPAFWNGKPGGPA